ncbi:uncharacterized protein LOC130695986 [Daphnia carinata]|uniref:uncharacterized protein LOC130695986 n=1 Tax=Daphnia carinata TaxID=120202 RepID=UPI00257A88A7|nr:uncharacterized protein LOC130695986 [Daphnia carinata]
MELPVRAVFLLTIAMRVYAGLPHTPDISSKPAPLVGPLQPQMPQVANDYGFRYAVNDFNGNEHSHQQRRVGNSVTGQYKVLLPDGRLQTVTYIADENGYRAKVDYTPGRPGEATTAGFGVPPPVPLRPGPLNVPFAAQKTAEIASVVEETQEQSPLLRRSDDDAVTKDIVDAEQIDLLSYDGSDEDRTTVKRGTRRLGSMPKLAHLSYNNRAGRIRFNDAYTSVPRFGSLANYRSPYTAARFAY